METDRLMELEEGFWREGKDFFDAHLTDDFRMLVPGMGAVNRAQTLAGIDDGARWSHVEMRDAAVTRLGPDAAVLSYHARAQRGDGGAAYTALVSSAYVRREGAWKIAFHHQTPVNG